MTEPRNTLKRLFAEYEIRAGLPLGVDYPDREAYIIPIWTEQIRKAVAEEIKRELANFALESKDINLKSYMFGILHNRFWERYGGK